MALLESLLASPRGDVQRLLGLHRRVIQEDARFYTHLAAWYAPQAALRDHLTLLLGELFRGSPSQRDVFETEPLLRNLGHFERGEPLLSSA